VLEAELAHHPGHGPRRASFVGDPAPVAQGAPLPPGDTLTVALDRLAGTWAANPWAQRSPALVTGSLRPPVGERPALLVDADGRGVPLLGEEPWGLLASTGGQVTSVFGELEATGFRPLAATEVA
jgi:hypothetical protein